MTRTSVLVFQNYPDSPPGLIAGEAEKRGIHLEILDASQGCTIPADAQRHHGLLILGGVMGAHDDHLAPRAPASSSPPLGRDDRLQPTLRAAPPPLSPPAPPPTPAAASAPGHR